MATKSTAKKPASSPSTTGRTKKPAAPAAPYPMPKLEKRRRAKEAAAAAAAEAAQPAEVAVPAQVEIGGEIYYRMQTGRCGNMLGGPRNGEATYEVVNDRGQEAWIFADGTPVEPLATAEPAPEPASAPQLAEAPVSDRRAELEVLIRKMPEAAVEILTGLGYRLPAGQKSGKRGALFGHPVPAVLRFLGMKGATVTQATSALQALGATTEERKVELYLKWGQRWQRAIDGGTPAPDYCTPAALTSEQETEILRAAGLA